MSFDKIPLPSEIESLGSPGISQYYIDLRADLIGSISWERILQIIEGELSAISLESIMLTIVGIIPVRTGYLRNIIVSTMNMSFIVLDTKISIRIGYEYPYEYPQFINNVDIRQEINNAMMKQLRFKILQILNGIIITLNVADITQDIRERLDNLKNTVEVMSVI